MTGKGKATYKYFDSEAATIKNEDKFVTDAQIRKWTAQYRKKEADKLSSDTENDAKRARLKNAYWPVIKNNIDAKFVKDETSFVTYCVVPNKDYTDYTFAKDEWRKSGGKWYYLYPDGIMATGWEEFELYGRKDLFYFHEKQTSKAFPIGALATGWTRINTSGKKNDKGDWFYFYPETKSGHTIGALATGWIRLKSQNQYEWFYLYPEEITTSKGAVIRKGTMATGWNQIEYNGKKDWYYFYPESKAKDVGHAEGSMATGWVKIKYNNKDEWFYFHPEAVRGQAKGTMATGWLDIGEDRYYLNKNGVMLTGKQTIDGKTYEFEADGRLKK